MEIRTKKELKFYILADRMMNTGYFHYPIRLRLFQLTVHNYIMDYLVVMRKCSYYKHQGGVFSKICYVYYRRKFHQLGVKLGFSMGCDTLGYAPWIPHHGTIVIGENNKLGKFACLHTSICITATNKSIGDTFLCGTGSRLTKVEVLGNNVQVGANSVVNKSFQRDGIVIAGAPAVYKKDCAPWYKDSIYEERVEKIEKLRKKLLNY